MQCLENMTNRHHHETIDLSISYSSTPFESQPYQPFDATMLTYPDSDNIMKAIGGYTSDHTQQSITAILKDEQSNTICSISGTTWNTLNKGFSTQNPWGHPYSNNPFNISESFDAYAERKQIQMSEITNTIEMGQLDFILLQEAKFFTDIQLESDVNNFKDALSALGWDYSAPSKEDNSNSFLTLWNTNTLEYTDKNNVFLNGSESCYTGYELSFVHSDSEQEISLINLHLDYTKDYSHEILEYQMDNMDKGIFTIMGGDTNHPQGFEQIGLLGNPDFASHICEDGPFIMDEQGTCVANLSTVRVIEEESFVKRYDGFFLSPSSEVTSIEAIEENGYYFKQNNDGTYQVTPLMPQLKYPHECHHHLEPGKPYVGPEYQMIFDEIAQPNQHILLEDIFTDFDNSILNDNDHQQIDVIGNDITAAIAPPSIVMTDIIGLEGAQIMDHAF